MGLFSVDMADPYACLAASHFNQMLGRYGSPLIVINLVKVMNHSFA